ncbi:hypothetical protein ACQFYA_21300 [Promicromonospora sp. Marseille-Q5078]
MTVTATPAATTEAWAALVKKQSDAYDEMQALWDDGDCTADTATGGDVACQTLLFSMGILGNVASVTFWDATLPEADSYMGEPPAEIADLVQETAAAADEVSGIGGEVDTACFQGSDCWQATDLENAWSALGDTYTGWDPYM